LVSFPPSLPAKLGGRLNIDCVFVCVRVVSVVHIHALAKLLKIIYIAKKKRTILSFGNVFDLFFIGIKYVKTK